LIELKRDRKKEREREREREYKKNATIKNYIAKIVMYIV